MTTVTFSADKPIAVVTGAASGLGLDLARLLAQRFQLVVIDVDFERLQTQFNQTDACLCVACDLSQTHAIKAMLCELTEQLPRVDLLVNNAGITHRSLAQVTDIDVIRRVMSVDYLAPVQLTQGLLPLLRVNKGKVVNIGSMAGWMPVMARAGYCAAKSALHQYFETLRAELYAEGVSILMVYPSFLDTPIEHNALDGQGKKAAHRRSMVGKMRSSQWMAELIVKAIEQRQSRLFPDRFTYISSLIYRLFPSLFIQLMRRKFASELEVKP